MLDNFSDLFYLHTAEFKHQKILFSEEEEKNFLNIISISIQSLPDMKITKEPHFHSHSFVELHFSLAGYAVYQFTDGSTIKIERGSWILFSKNYSHKIIEYSEQYIKYTCSFDLVETRSDAPSFSSVSLNAIKQFLESNSMRYGKTSDISEQLIANIYPNLFDSHPFNRFILKNFATNIILDSLIPCCQNVQFLDTNQTKNDMRFSVALQFIKDNIYRKISTEDVAQKVYLSSRQIDRIFQNNMSISVSEYISEQKSAEAKDLLCHTSIPVQEISEMLGFSTPSYFNHFFKRRVGVPPYRFRMINKKAALDKYNKTSAKSK